MFRGFGQGWGLLQADLVEPFLLQFYALSGDYPAPVLERRRLEPAETLSEFGPQRTRIPEGRSSRRSRRSWTAGDTAA